MRTGFTFVGFIIFFTGLCLAVAALGSLFFTPSIATFSVYLFAGSLNMWMGLFVLKRCATFPISDQRPHISHKLAR